MKRLTYIPAYYFSTGPRPFSTQHSPYYEGLILELITAVQDLEVRAGVSTPTVFWGYELILDAGKYILAKKDISLGLEGTLVWSGLLTYGFESLDEDPLIHQHGKHPGAVLPDWGTEAFEEGDLIDKGKTLAGNLIEQIRIALWGLMPALGSDITTWELQFKELTDSQVWNIDEPWYLLGDNFFNLDTEHIETLRVSARTLLNATGPSGMYQVEGRLMDQVEGLPVDTSNKLAVRAAEQDVELGFIPVDGVQVVLEAPAATYFLKGNSLFESYLSTFREFTFAFTGQITDACYFGEDITGLYPGYDNILVLLQNGQVAVLAGHYLAASWELIGHITPTYPSDALLAVGRGYTRADALPYVPANPTGIDAALIEDPGLLAVADGSKVMFLTWGGDPDAGPSLGTLEVEGRADVGVFMQGLSFERAGGISPEAPWLIWRLLIGAGREIRAIDLYPGKLAEIEIIDSPGYLLASPWGVFYRDDADRALSVTRVAPWFRYRLIIPAPYVGWERVRGAVSTNPDTGNTVVHALYNPNWVSRIDPDFVHLTWELPSYSEFIGRGCDPLGDGSYYLNIYAEEHTFSIPGSRVDTYDPRLPSERPGAAEPAAYSHDLYQLNCVQIAEGGTLGLSFLIKATFEPTGEGRRIAWLYHDEVDIDEPFDGNLQIESYVNVSGGWATRSLTAGENRFFVLSQGLQDRLDNAYEEPSFVVVGAIEDLTGLHGKLCFRGNDSGVPYYVVDAGVIPDPAEPTVYILDVSSAYPCRTLLNVADDFNILGL